MATSTLQLVVETNTRQLDGLVSKFKKTEGQLERLQGKLRTGLARGLKAAGNAGQEAARKISDGFKRAAGAAERFQKKLGGVRSTLLGLGVGAAAGFAVKTAASFEQTQLRLKLLSKEYREFNLIQKLVAQNAETFNQSQRESAENFANVYARLRPLGKTLTEIQTTYEGFNAVAIASGASAQEVSAAFLQLRQALGSGRLQGDEFRSISEQVPGILKLVSDELGVTVGELKTLGSEGKITSDILINALAKGFEQNKDAIADLIALSPAQKFKAFQNSVDELAVAVGQELLPALIPLVQAATSLLEQFGKLPGPIKTATVAITALGAAALIAAPAISALLGGLAAFAPAAVAAGAGAKTLAGALVLLKGALIAIPWVAAAAAITGLIGLTVNYYKEQAELNRLINGGSTDINEYQSKISQLQSELQGASSRLEEMKEKGISNARALQSQERKVRELKAQLEALEGTYDVFVRFNIQYNDALSARSMREGANGPEVILPGVGIFDKDNNLIEDLSKPKLPKLPDLGGGSSSGGGGGATRESEIPALTRQVELSNKLLENSRALLEAQFNSNTQRIESLKYDRIALELEGKIAEINAEAIPDQEKELKIKLAQNEATKSQVELNYELLEADKQRLETLEGITKPIEDEIELLQARLNGNEDEIRQLQEIRDLRKSIADAGGDPSRAAGLVQQRDALRASVEEADQLRARYEELADGISKSMSSAFRDVITGAKSAEQALADAFQGIADAFLDMAFKMIQEWLKMQVLGIVGGAIGGGGGAIGSFGSPFSAGEFSGGYGPGAFKLDGFFADGGYVTGPTTAMIGEGGEPEYVIPASKMESSLARYSAGARGESVTNGDSSAAGGVTGGGSTVVNYSGPILNFNEQDYVPASAVPEIINAAAKKGAAGGYAKSMSSLKNNRSQRSKLGL